jgi:uncharacterized membrane protein YfcA
MLDPKATLLLCLALVGIAFSLFFVRGLRRARIARGPEAPDGVVKPGPYELFVGFFTDFFDTLGIGSFATTTTLYRWRKTIDDRLLPGTLNVGHTLPTIAQAFFFIEAVKVEMTTLIAMIVAAVLGALLGAPIVSRWPRRYVQIGLGLSLLFLCAILVYRQFGDPTGGDATGLHGARFWIGVGANFVLGALMTIGVGLYAPCLMLVSMLGMNPTAGFPIMMGSCAFLMPLASVEFIRRGCYSARAALGLTLAGVPAVVIAVMIVKSLPLYYVKWLVAAVIIYTAINLLRAARTEAPDGSAPDCAPPDAPTKTR